MTILARFIPKNVVVEIQYVFECSGVKLACVRALEGKPFVAGNKWPVATEYATVPATDLVDIGQSAGGWPPPTNLLSLALAAARPQWHSGQSVWLVGGPRKGAFLKNLDGFVLLFVVGCSKGLPVFHYDPKMGGWRECETLRKNYQAWAEATKQAIERGIGAR